MQYSQHAFLEGHPRWEMIRLMVGQNETIHIVPFDDTRAHLFAHLACSCGPDADEQPGRTVYLHKAFDGRPSPLKESS